MDKYLIIIDMQNDFVTGPLGTPEAVAIVNRIKNKIRTNFDFIKEIVFTRDTHTRNYLNTQEGQKLPIKHCIFETAGWVIVEELIEEYYANISFSGPSLKILNKNTFGNLEWGFLERPTEIEICGVCTDICVISNALILKALFPEAKIIVDASCCAGTTPEMHKKALEIMKSCQIEIINE